MPLNPNDLGNSHSISPHPHWRLVNIMCVPSLDLHTFDWGIPVRAYAPAERRNITREAHLSFAFSPSERTVHSAHVGSGVRELLAARCSSSGSARKQNVPTSYMARKPKQGDLDGAFRCATRLLSFFVFSILSFCTLLSVLQWRKVRCTRRPALLVLSKASSPYAPVKRASTKIRAFEPCAHLVFKFYTVLATLLSPKH